MVLSQGNQGTSPDPQETGHSLLNWALIIARRACYSWEFAGCITLLTIPLLWLGICQILCFFLCHQNFRKKKVLGKSFPPYPANVWLAGHADHWCVFCCGYQRLFNNKCWKQNWSFCFRKVGLPPTLTKFLDSYCRFKTNRPRKRVSRILAKGTQPQKREASEPLFDPNCSLDLNKSLWRIFSVENWTTVFVFTAGKRVPESGFSSVQCQRPERPPGFGHPCRFDAKRGYPKPKAWMAPPVRHVGFLMRSYPRWRGGASRPKAQVSSHLIVQYRVLRGT